MSKQLTVVAAGASAGLQGFAAQLLNKVAVKPVPAEVATANSVVIGTESPNGAHTCVTSAAGAASGAYAGVNTVLVRAVLPKGDGNTVAVRDAVDVLPSAGIDSAAETAAAKAAFQESAKVALAAAQKANAKIVTIVVKQQSKYENLNTLFAEVATEVIEGGGISTETVVTSQATNNLVMFPETQGVLFTADTPAAETIEQAFAGVAGGLVRTFHLGNGTAAAGHSTATVAKACAASLKALGLTAEASKIEAAAAKATNDGGKAILGAL